MPRQGFPIEKHHEVGQFRFVIAIGANLAHQIHAHGVTAKCKKQAVTQRQNAGVTPDQIHGQRTHGVTHDFAYERHGEITHVQGMLNRQPQIQHRNKHTDHK